MLLFILRLLINLSKLLFICIPLEIIGWIILIPVCLLQDTSLNKKLPVFLKIFDNADLYIDRDQTTYLQVMESGRVNRYLWLAFRNPINYFGYKVLGKQVLNHSKDKTNGNFLVGDSKDHQPGFLYNELDDIYEYYYVFKYNNQKCFRFRMGWKIGNPALNQVNDYIQWCMVIQPYKDYEGIS